MFVAITVRNWTFASSGSPAMYTTASATWRDVHHRLDADRAVGLERALRRCRRVSSVAALPMSIWPQAMLYARPSSDDRLRQAGDRVLGRGVGDGLRSRHVGRDRAVVDDPPALRPLRLHQPERLLGAQEAAGQVRVDDRPPLLERQLFERRRRADMPALLNSRSTSSPVARDALEQLAHGLGVGDIGRDHERIVSRLRAPASVSRAASLASTGQRDPIARSSSDRVTARPMPDPAPVTTATGWRSFTSGRPRRR